MTKSGKFEILSINPAFNNQPAAIADFCNDTIAITFPFLQDTAAVDVHTKYSAVKHDLFVIGHDGTIRNQWTAAGSGQLNVDVTAGQTELRDALNAAMAP